MLIGIALLVLSAILGATGSSGGLIVMIALDAVYLAWVLCRFLGASGARGEKPARGRGRRGYSEDDRSAVVNMYAKKARGRQKRREEEIRKEN